MADRSGDNRIEGGQSTTPVPTTPDATKGRGRSRSSLALFMALGGRQRLRPLSGLLAMALGGAVLEVLGVGLVFPLISLVQEPGQIDSSEWLGRIHALLGEPSITTFVITLALAMVGVFMAKSIYMIIYHHVELRVLAEWRKDVSRSLMSAYLNAPYSETSADHSAGPIRTIARLVPKLFDGFVRSTLALVANAVAITGLIIVAIAFEPLVIAVGIAMLLLIRVQDRAFSRRLRRLGEAFTDLIKSRQRILQESFGGLKEAKVLGREGFFIDTFAGTESNFVDNRRRSMFLSSLPPHLTEVILSCGILLLIVSVLSTSQSPGATLGTLAVLAAASFRIAPLANRMLVALNAVSYGRSTADVVVTDLERGRRGRSSETTDSVGFKQIDFANVWFRNQDAREPILCGIDLTLRSGECVGLIGSSGVGKSTLGDILLGLLEPIEGRILVDGESVAGEELTARISPGYVPQDVFILDDTIRRNVAFGLPDEVISDEEVWGVLVQAQMREHVESLPDGLETRLGEGGARFSAGERQRIGLARALYHKTELLLLDEFTGALDTDTEAGVLKAIDALKGQRTIVVIAHRRSALSACDRILILENGRLRETAPNLDDTDAAASSSDRQTLIAKAQTEE